MRHKIENYTQFQKDTDSKAILNVDKNALTAYKIQRNSLKKTMDVAKEIDSLKQDISELKSLLYQIINNK